MPLLLSLGIELNTLRLEYPSHFISSETSGPQSKLLTQSSAQTSSVLGSLSCVLLSLVEINSRDRGHMILFCMKAGTASPSHLLSLMFGQVVHTGPPNIPPMLTSLPNHSFLPTCDNPWSESQEKRP